MQVLNLVTNPDAQFFQQQLAALGRRGIATETVAVPGDRTTTDDESSSRSVLDYLRFYPRVLRASLGDHDIVHANYGLTAPAALAQPTRPVVLSLWGSDLFGRYGPVSRWCARRADAVVVMTEEMADALGPVDAHVIPHGIDLSLFRPLPAADARARVGWDHDALHVLFPYAKQRPVKDYPRAAAVVEAVRSRLDTPVRLQTLSGVPHEMMPVYLNAADSLLITSSHEGSPNTVKEALACNRPVVSTDVGDVAERLDGVTQTRVGRTDAELVEGLLAVLARGEPSDGRDRVRSLSLARTSERLARVYESVGR
jgi:glycosyltransferase involved in cell wall biosynthesis